MTSIKILESPIKNIDIKGKFSKIYTVERIEDDRFEKGVVYKRTEYTFVNYNGEHVYTKSIIGRSKKLITKEELNFDKTFGKVFDDFGNMFYLSLTSSKTLKEAREAINTMINNDELVVGVNFLEV